MQVSVSVKTTVRIIFVVVVGNGRPSLLLAPGAADPENGAVSCSAGGSGSEEPLSPQEKKKLAVLCWAGAQRSAWGAQIASNSRYSICRRTSHGN